jgi:anti-sigma regulatory factor (Ser/Thr protein kinase)
VTDTCRFRCDPASVPAARRFVRDALREHSREVIDAAELMACELATNCVRHARTDFELVIRSHDQIRVEVRDTGQGRPRPRSPTPREPSGRGLRIVEAMSSTWGIIPSSNGKTVWFTLPRASNATSRSGAAGERPAAEGTDPERPGRERRDARSPRRARMTPRSGRVPLLVRLPG